MIEDKMTKKVLENEIEGHGGMRRPGTLLLEGRVEQFC